MAQCSSAAASRSPLHFWVLFTYVLTFVSFSHAQTPASDLSTMAAIAPSLKSSPEGTSLTPTTLATIVSTSSTPSSSSLAAGPDPSDDIFSFHDNKDDAGKIIAFNYYFLFLAALAVGIGVLLWWLHRKRKVFLERRQRNGQQALAQDMDGLMGQHRITHGLLRVERVVPREDGLDHQGQAPPPYQPKSDSRVVINPHVEVALPLQTLSRDGQGRNDPPEYTPNSRSA